MLLLSKAIETMKNIFVLTNDTRDVDLSVTQSTVSVLLALGCNVALLPHIHLALNVDGVGIIGDKFDISQAELVIVIGGDGSILDASRDAIANRIPVLGINAGHLGYLSGMDKDEISILPSIIQGRYCERNLMTFSIRIYRGNETIEISRRAVNEAVVSHGSLTRLSDIEVSCGSSASINYRADGVIISTPAGSTAYSLSAGGPIIESTLDSVCVTPICPHSFFARSVIVSPESVVRVRCNNDDKTDLYLTVDGRENFALRPGDIVEIGRSPDKFKLVSAREHDLLGVLKQKMNMN